MDVRQIKKRQLRRFFFCLIKQKGQSELVKGIPVIYSNPIRNLGA